LLLSASVAGIPYFRLPRLRDDTESMRMGAPAREVWRERFSPEVITCHPGVRVQERSR
jgi:hypothetical protein